MSFLSNIMYSFGRYNDLIATTDYMILSSSFVYGNRLMLLSACPSQLISPNDIMYMLLSACPSLLISPDDLLSFISFSVHKEYFLKPTYKCPVSRFDLCLIANSRLPFAMLAHIVRREPFTQIWHT